MKHKQVVYQLDKVPHHSYRETYKVNYPVKPKTLKEFLNLPLLLDYLATKFLEKRSIIKPTLVTDVSYSEVVIDGLDIKKLVFKCIDSFYNQYGTLPKTVLIGNAQYRKLNEEFSLNSFTKFMSANPLKILSELGGVNVVLVPYMDGVLALRDDYAVEHKEIRYDSY